MTQAAKLPSTATRRTGGSQPPLNGDGSRGVVGWRGEIRDSEVVKTHEEALEEEQREQDLRGEQDLVGDRDHGNDRDDRTDRDERDSHDEQSGQQARREQDTRRENRAVDRDDHSEQDLSRNQGGVQRAVEQVTDRVRAATSNPVDAFATTPDMSKVLTAWFDVAGDMMKLQQRFFASMLGAGNTNDRTTTKV